MSLLFPHTFHDGIGEIASGQQVMDNLNALKEAIEGTAWVAPTFGSRVQDGGNAPGVGQPPATYACACRLELAGAVVRLRGSARAQIGGGSTISAGKTIITLPVGYRPAVNIKRKILAGYDDASEPAYLTIATTGVVTCDKDGPYFAFEGITFGLT